MKIYDYELKIEEKGITLIALVITIVILLILAAVSINAVLGDNGIIKKANEAKSQYNNADIEEKANMDELLASIEKIEAGEEEDTINGYFIYPHNGNHDNLDTENTWSSQETVTFHDDDGYFNLSTPDYCMSTVYTKDTVDLSQYNSIIVKKTSSLMNNRCGFQQYPNWTNNEGQYISLTYTSLGDDYANFYVADLSSHTRDDLKFYISSYGHPDYRNDGDYYLVLLLDKTVAEVIADHSFLNKYL